MDIYVYPNEPNISFYGSSKDVLLHPLHISYMCNTLI